MSQSEATDNGEEESSSSLTLDDLVRGIDLLKQKFPFFTSIGIWVTLQGYWHCISPSSALAHEYTLFPCAFRKEQGDNTTNSHLPLFEHWPRFWKDYFTALKAAGITFVKVDNQAYIDTLTEGEEEAKIKAYGQAVMSKAAQEVFGDGMVHCMSQSGRFVAGEFGLGVDPTSVGAVAR